VDNLPDGYDTIVGERGVTLSGGPEAALSPSRGPCCAIPSILVLDDATSSVDMETEFLIQQALEVLIARAHNLHRGIPAPHG